MNNVRSEPIKSNAKAPSRPRIGFLDPGHIETAFIILLYTALAALVLLSILGTFYGWRGTSAPLAEPWRIWQDIQTADIWPPAIIQILLTVAQWGSRQLSRRDRRWWILYLVALGFSVYYNVQAYWVPLTDVLPWYAAGALIVAGDVLPEFMAVRRD